MKQSSIILCAFLIGYACAKKAAVKPVSQQTVITIESEIDELELQLNQVVANYDGTYLLYSEDSIANGVGHFKHAINNHKDEWYVYSLVNTDEENGGPLKYFAFHPDDKEVMLTVTTDTTVVVTGSQFHYLNEKEVEFFSMQQYKRERDSLAQLYPNSFMHGRIGLSSKFPRDCWKVLYWMDTTSSDLKYLQTQQLVASMARGFIDIYETYNPSDYVPLDQVVQKDTILWYNWGSWCVNCPNSFPKLDSIEKQTPYQVIALNPWDWDKPEKPIQIYGDYHQQWEQITLDSTKAEIYLSKFDGWGAPLIVVTDESGMMIDNYIDFITRILPE